MLQYKIFKLKQFILGVLRHIVLHQPIFFKFYYIFNPLYSREKRAVFNGLRTHILNFKKKSNAEYKLRRNIHRLEKGITHLNPRETFALSYINETIIALEIELKNDRKSQTVIWAIQVLNDYFQRDSSNDIFKSNKIAYKNILFRYKVQIPNFETEQFKVINYDSLKDLTLSRKSIRWFDQTKQVSKELLEKALYVANQAPSACNRQPIKAYIYNDPSTIQRVTSIPTGASTFYQNIPVFILLVGDLSAYSHERDRHTIYVDGGLFAMNLMLALNTLGLASCPINWPDVRFMDKRLRKVIRLEKYEQCVMSLAVGYALEGQSIPLSIRRPLNEIVVYNKLK